MSTSKFSLSRWVKLIVCVGPCLDSALSHFMSVRGCEQFFAYEFDVNRGIFVHVKKEFSLYDQMLHL